MTKFKLPRKLKKELKKGFWLYPADSEGTSEVAWPATDEKDYKAFKNSEIKDFLNRFK